MGMVLNYSKIILKSMQQRFSSQKSATGCIVFTNLQAPQPGGFRHPGRFSHARAQSWTEGVAGPRLLQLCWCWEPWPSAAGHAAPSPPVSVFPSPSPIGTPAFAPEPPSPSTTASQPDASAETLFPNTVMLAASRGWEFWGDRIQPRAPGDTACLKSG